MRRPDENRPRRVLDQRFDHRDPTLFGAVGLSLCQDRQKRRPPFLGLIEQRLRNVAFLVHNLETHSVAFACRPGVSSWRDVNGTQSLGAEPTLQSRDGAFKRIRRPDRHKHLITKPSLHVVLGQEKDRDTKHTQR